MASSASGFFPAATAAEATASHLVCGLRHRRTIDRRRARRCGHRDPETAQAMLPPLEEQLDGQFRAPFEADRLVELEHRRMVAARRLAHRPARGRILIDRAARGETLGGRRRRHRRERGRHRLPILRGHQRLRRHHDPRQPEAAVLARARAGPRRRRARERLQPQGRQALGARVKHRPVRVVGLELARRRNDRVGAGRERRLLPLHVAGVKPPPLPRRPGRHRGLHARQRGDEGLATQLLHGGRKRLAFLLPGLDRPGRRRRIRVHRLVGLHGVSQAGDQGVVVALADGVVLVIVTAGAPDRHPQRRRAERHRHVVELIVADRLDRLRRHLVRIGAGHEQAGRSRRLDVVGPQQVAGHLQPEELVVGHVGVERPDHEVAVVEGVAPVPVELVAAALAVADHVEPVPGPPLAELRAGEQPLHDFLIRIRRGIGQKRLQLLRRRRQSDEIERHPAQQRRLRRLGVGNDARRLLPGADEAVDVVFHPGRVLDRGRRHAPEPAIRPVIAAGGDVDLPRLDRGRRPGPRIGHPHLEPGREVGDHAVGQLALRRHLQALVADGVEQQALFLVAGHECRPALAPLEHPVAGVEEQLRLQPAGRLRLRRMALVALGHEHRADLRLEERDPLGRGLRGKRRAGRDNEAPAEQDNWDPAEQSAGETVNQPPHRGWDHSAPIERIADSELQATN